MPWLYMFTDPFLDKLMPFPIFLVEAHPEIMFTLIHYIARDEGGGWCSGR
jgi:hypothetical protein